MDREAFWELIFNAVAPRNCKHLSFGTDIADHRAWMEKNLSQVEKLLGEEETALIARLRDNCQGALAYTEKGYFIAGVQFGVQLLYAALGSD